MKRSFTATLMSSLCGGWMILSLAGFSSVAMAQSALTIDLDGARRLVLKAPAKDVIVGNPAVADVTVISPTNLIVIGHAPGRTRLLVLDSDQVPLLDQVVIVTQGDSGLVSVFGPRGGTMSQDNYACGYHCTLIPGGRVASKAGTSGNFSEAPQSAPTSEQQAPSNTEPAPSPSDNNQPPATQDTKPSY